ncbi:hypothetical protein NIES2101_09350 [Calothrix sp. HK-06]|nr:hypothetical protein NIES2101_09350 [Calothrix sp. HK-06]
MNTPRRLRQNELGLIQRFANCQLGMTPREFEAKWDVTRAQMAALCNCSVANVKRWFEQGENFSPPTKYHMRYLALADIFLESFDEIPEQLQQRICPS